MKIRVIPSSLSGEIIAPASKSAMQRACAAALIRKGETHLYNYGISNDDHAALGIIQSLGAIVEYEKDKIIITGNNVDPIRGNINCGESGLSIRMFTSIAALSTEQIIIDGTGSLLKRPQSFFNEVLPLLGVSVESNKGYLPLTIQGPLQPKNITIDGSLSSQFLTGLIFAYSAINANDVTIHVKELNSKPYIDLTLKVLSDFQLPVPVNNNYESFTFHAKTGGELHDTPLKYCVESDWSGAAFLLVAGAINGNITVKGLDVFSTQADKAVLQALMQAGVSMSIEQDQIEIRHSTLKAFHFNATDCPDLFPPLVALAAYCKGTSVIEGVNRLIHKESNRALTLQEEFGKLGVEINLQDDLMIIKGEEEVSGGIVHSHHDHRIAMACAVAALKATGPVLIEEAKAVNKSYPQFWEHLQHLNAHLSI